MLTADFTVNAWIYLAVGLLLAFFGRGLVILQLGLLGALFGALGGSALLGLLVAQGLSLPPDVPLAWVQVGALLVGALVGWVLAGLVRRVAVFVLGAVVGGAALAQLGAGWPEVVPAGVAWLVGAFLGGILLLALEGPLLKLGTAVLGGLLVTSALSVLVAPEQAGLAALAGLGATVVGAVAQLARR